MEEAATHLEVKAGPDLGATLHDLVMQRVAWKCTVQRSLLAATWDDLKTGALRFVLPPSARLRWISDQEIEVTWEPSFTDGYPSESELLALRDQIAARRKADQES